MASVFGEVLTKAGSLASEYTFEELVEIIERPFIKPRYRICILNPDETVAYEIPNEHIPEDGIDYTEEYQDGQRRNISLKLINSDGRYTPSLSSLWVNTRFSFEMGLEIYNGQILWFPKGVYVMGNINLTVNGGEKMVTVQLLDKFAIFEGKTGTLEVAYEVETGSLIIDAVRGILNFTMGNGYILDYKDVIFDPSLVNMVTQTSIRCESGDNYGSVIKELATQLSAEYYYNNLGNLCFYPINETVNDDAKPIIWSYRKFGRDLHNLELSYQNENIVNCIKVVGDNVDNGIYSAVAKNENPASPICVQQIGTRWENPYMNANVWSDDLAKDLAEYYLRKASFVSVEFSCEVSYNPLLTVNNICEVENDDLNLKRDKLLLTSISFSSRDGLMSASFCNTIDLPY